jgi:hypothetical protein
MSMHRSGSQLGRTNAEHFDDWLLDGVGEIVGSAQAWE